MRSIQSYCYIASDCICYKGSAENTQNIHRMCGFFQKRIKTKNILNSDGIYKLNDFGLALKMNQQKNLDKEFPIPQVIKKQAYNEQIQVWNMGLIFHEILFGDLPEQMISSPNYWPLHQASTCIFKRGACNYHQQVINFLQNTLQINPEDRMSWKQLVNHPIFDLIRPKLLKPIDNNQRQKIQTIENIEQKIDNRMSNLIAISERELQSQPDRQNELLPIYEKKFRIQNQLNQIQRKLEEPYQKLGRQFQIQQLSSQSQQPLRNKANKDQHKTYQSLKSYYFQCLKVEFIYYEIIKNLAKLKQFNQNRKNIEFIYLIISRCFIQMSNINFINKKNPSKTQSIMKLCVQRQTNKLYSLVQKEWRKYQQLVKKCQDQILNIFFDKIKSYVFRQKIYKKDLIMGGIQNFDYTKQQQIQYTFNYYMENIYNEFKNLSIDNVENYQISLSRNKIIKYMSKYKQLWLTVYLPQNCETIEDYMNQICTI